MDLSKFLENNSATIIVFILLLVFFTYIHIYINRKKSNCQNIVSNVKSVVNNEYTFDELETGGYFRSGNYNYRIKDFYIKTAYNAFCSGTFKNDYVDFCALENCKQNGVRALDMQIFSVNGKPVIASNSNDSNIMKETYNYIDLDEGIDEISTKFLQSDSNNKHPLFLNFRIHYGDGTSNSRVDEMKKKFYEQIYLAIVNNDTIKKRLFSQYQRTFNDNYDDEREDIVPNLPFADSENKVFIFATLNGETGISTAEDTSLNSIVDLYTNDFGISAVRSDEIGDDSIFYKNLSKQTLLMCYPQLGHKSLNYDFVVPFSNGIQFVAMNFQTYDKNLDHYNIFFKNEIGSSDSSNKATPYIKKPDHMLDMNTGSTSHFIPNMTYLIESEGNKYCIDAEGKSITDLDCSIDSSDNNYQLFKFVKTAEGKYAIKTLMRDKYCRLDGTNNIICDADSITDDGQFLIDRVSYNNYTIRDNTGENCAINSSGEMTCSDDSNNRGYEFTILKKLL